MLVLCHFEDPAAYLFRNEGTPKQKLKQKAVSISKFEIK
jgi:hypothetical protein